MMIKGLSPRLYQETIFSTAAKKNTLVVLPTGMGKTIISVMLASHRLNNYPNHKIIILAPTKPLVEQHLNSFKNFVDLKEDEFTLFTGMISPKKRQELWKNSKVIFSTPQGLENDVISSRIDLKEVSLLVFDEAHRAVGDYSYVFLAEQFNKKADFPRILALTASPGSDIETIDEVTKNLFIEDVEIRTDKDPDVRPYIKDINTKMIKLDLPPPFLEIQKLLKDFIKDRLNKVKKLGILKRANVDMISKKDLLSLQAQLRSKISSGEKDFTIWTSISLLAEVMKISHALELLETQSIISAHKYLKKLKQESISSKVKAVKNIVSDIRFKQAFFKLEKAYDENYEHPKLIELQKIIKKTLKNKNNKIIVFNQYRDNAENIVETLDKIPGIKAKLFIGQAKKNGKGLSQKRQIELLNDFKENKFNVIVMTSVGEEGLDIPKVDMVVFYEPVPSAIRHIQRRGRTGRQEKGEVIVLMANKTKDEAYRWSAHHKEKKMVKILNNMKNNLKIRLNDNTKKINKKDYDLDKFIKKAKIKIFADYREKGTKVIKDLINLGAEIKLEKLETADFILSSRTGVEFKTVQDFVDSIVDGRLLEQIKQLKNNFDRPLIIIEGKEDIYSIRNIHPNAIRGMLATISVSYNIPMIYTKNNQDTAEMLYIIAKREQEKSKNFSLHFEKRIATLKEQQEYVVSSFPNVGRSIAKDILKEFKTIKNVINLDVDDLKKIDKVGDKKAKDLFNLFNKRYEE